MKNKLIISITMALSLSTTLLAVIGGPHGNIGSGSNATDNGEVCIYCHTPHAANNFGPVPIWNKPTSPLTYMMYGATAAGVAGKTVAGTFTDATPTDQTLACLSCHDGVTALDSVINAPGSGRTDINGIEIGGYSSTKIMPNNQSKAVGMPTVLSGPGDLRNDHPLSIVYTPGKAGLKATNDPLSGWLGAQKVGDLLRSGKVQCVSCHDVHDDTNLMYRRISNNNSDLCLGCHEK